nr:uncharacterized protein LOC128696805 isoform X1 [Cherax quadricarinatus]
MASEKVNQAVLPLPNPRMDDLKGTVSDFGNELTVMNKQMEKKRVQKEMLQKTVEAKREHIEALRAEIRAFIAKETELKEQEKLQLARIQQSNADLTAVKTKLAKSRARRDEFRQATDQLVRKFEASSHDIAREYSNLRLRERQQDEGVFTDDDLDQKMEKQAEVERLNSMKNALASSSPKRLPTETMKNIVKECQLMVDRLKKINEDLQFYEASLQKRLEMLRDELSHMRPEQVINNGK